MRFKLDENFGTRTQKLFRQAGHDVQTVRDEGLAASPDRQIYEFCRKEKRCLVTLDVNFADAVQFPPQDGEGLAVIRTPRNPSPALLEELVEQFLDALDHLSIQGQLWVVEVGRIRIHQADEGER